MMNILYYLNTFIFLLHIGDQSNELSSITISNLRCEYLINPLGIDVINPRLSWELISNKRAQSQFSYQILVDSDSIALNEDKANTWNSNKVESGQTSQLNYGGKKLKSGNKYYWKVRIWDKKGNASGWSPIASWSMGLLNQADWQAKWIGAVPEQIPNQSKYYIHYGYHSAFASTSDSKDKWVVVDIGSLEEITQIKLYPVDFQTQPNGYLFPNRFLIEVSGNEAFNQSTIIADESGNDYEKIGMEPYIKDFAPVTARFIKVSVSKLANVDSARYAFAMAELEVLNNKNENLALNKKVTASDVHNIYQQFSNQNWLPGYISSFHKMNLWILEPQDGKIALAFTNSPFDPAKDVILMLRTEYDTITMYDMNCKEILITSSGVDGPYKEFIIPYVDPWQVRLIISG